ncbi:MAG: phosphatase PAP2 family protein [Bacteroidota bacterium]
MTIKQILDNNKIFVMPFLIFILGGAFFLAIYPLEEGHLLLNKYHNDFFDSFFKYATYLGDGIVFGIAIVLGLFIRYRISLYAAITGLLTLFLISYISKELLFHDYPRPANVFRNLDIQLHYVKGVKMHMISSFPSGHTTTAFALYTLLALFCKRNVAKLSLFFLAVIAGLSRVYLSQHFVKDIEAGAIVGFITALLVYYYMNKKTGKNKKLDKSLLNPVN